MVGKVVALAGGVGGAKLALGLSRILPADQLVIVGNTGDDESFHGLHVSPDLDTLMYSLAGLSNSETGWGLAGETFQSLGMLSKYGAETWFNLGDKDLATHIRRTQLLGQGYTLSQATAELCRCLEVDHPIVPMSDSPVPTFLDTDVGRLSMQRYFVQHRCEPGVRGIEYEGGDRAAPAPMVADALEQASMIVFCPSNPFLSVAPILAVPGIKQSILRCAGRVPRVVVSPIVGGAALRGPAAKIMAELGFEASSLGVAKWYQGLCDTFLIDHQDAGLAPAIGELGMTPLVASTIMESEEDKVELAGRVLNLGGSA
jgi:LPPG:FO 2-phospho-L-lactate transferase